VEFIRYEGVEIGQECAKGSCADYLGCGFCADEVGEGLCDCFEG
jgi:hypothetical protein